MARSIRWRLASLPIALGEATKTVPFVMDGAKTYRFTLKFGRSRATDDAGAPSGSFRPAPERRGHPGPSPFHRRDRSDPPVYSAIKVEGERAYDWPGRARLWNWSRAGRIDDFPPSGRLSADEAVFEVQVRERRLYAGSGGISPYLGLVWAMFQP